MAKGRFGLKDIKQRAQKGAEQNLAPESAQSRNSASDEPLAYMSVRVPKSHRDWWAGQCKLSGETLTDVIKELMEQKFGLPGGE